MATSIAEGFYKDPESGKTFFLKKRGKMLLIPPWVKTDPLKWQAVKVTENATKINQEGQKASQKNEKRNGKDA